MKPVAPPLLDDDTQRELPSLQSEIRGLCDGGDGGDHERITIPAPPSAEVLRLATPIPPPDHVRSPDTIPSPPPSSARRPIQPGEAEDSVPSTIPGPPRLPSIAS